MSCEFLQLFFGRHKSNVRQFLKFSIVLPAINVSIHTNTKEQINIKIKFIPTMNESMNESMHKNITKQINIKIKILVALNKSMN